MFILGLWIQSQCFAVDIPAGWKQRFDSRKNAQIFQPVDSNSGILIKYYPKELLGKIGISDWLNNKLTNSKAPVGEWSDDLKPVVRESFNRAYKTRGFSKPDGSTGYLVAVAFSADLLYVRLGIIIFNKKEKNKVYLDQSFDILKEMDKVEIANAKEEWRGLDLETGAPKVAGVKKGGEIKPGRYVGSKTINGEVRSRYQNVIPKGKQMRTKPIPAGTRLEGNWNATTTYIGSDFSSSSSWGVLLSKDGRFVNYSRETLRVNGSNLV
jgi:hypothetical protein